MAIKKLKIVERPLLIPEGFSLLPTPLLLYQKSTQTLWANPIFEAEFGAANLSRFNLKSNLTLIRKRPVSIDVFSMVGRHEGFVLENKKGESTPIELKISYFDEDAETYLILIENVESKVELENQIIEKHIELQNAFENLKKTQNALVQSAKLASLGELSSGIAHELNQPLQAIMGFSQELEHIEKLTPTGKEFVTDIIGASKKMAEIIRSLRSFAREAGDEMIDVSVEHAVSESKKLMHHALMQAGIEIEIEIAPKTPLIKANGIQLEQVLVNLFSNAKDAIEATKRGDGVIKLNVSHTPKEVIVAVKDNGCGMSEATQQRIFDPFFTTKEVGKGTGLGLSISYGILKKFNAKTTVKSKPGEGTEFTIRFPISKGETP